MEKANIKSYSVVKSMPVEWLWYPYIPIGKITILQGDPGDGKTSFILYLASILSSGRDNNIIGLTKEKINIIYQSYEDDLEDTISPKLKAFGADSSSIFFIDTNDNLTLDSKILEETIINTKAKLLILDPLQSFIGEASMNNAGDLRPVFKKLTAIAKKNKCAIVIIGHMNKQSGTKELYRSLGSIDIVAIARSVLYLKTIEEKSNFRILTQIKNNLSAKGKPISFEFIGDNKIRYIGVINDETNINKTSKIDEISNVLLSTLINKEIKATAIYEIGKERGISERTINEAKKKLGVRTIKKKDGWYWTIKSDGDFNGRQ